MRPDILTDLCMVHNPQWWPIDGALPLTHRTEMESEPNPMGLHKLGFILEADVHRNRAGHPITVHVGCLHLTALGITRLEELAEERYETAVKMLEKWRVD